MPQLIAVIQKELLLLIRDKAGLLVLFVMPAVLETAITLAPVPVMEVYFDPTVLGGFRSAVRNLLDLMVLRLEVSEKMAALGRMLPERINQSLASALEHVADYIPRPPQVDLQMKWSDLPLLRIENREALTGGMTVILTSVQQNVPAWSQFGIFFIVLPVAGAFIQDRINRIHQRLLAMSMGYLTLMCGRILAYMGLCVVQCALIGGIGKWVLPLWGTPSLDMGGDPLALLVMAATGYGILLGTVVDSYEQASMFGPIFIVIAAALGGIMVPVYAMPDFMQKVSVISPLAWGLNGTLDVFVRGGGLADVLPEAGVLTAFFAWLWQRRRR